MAQAQRRVRETTCCAADLIRWGALRARSSRRRDRGSVGAVADTRPVPDTRPAPVSRRCNSVIRAVRLSSTAFRRAISSVYFAVSRSWLR